MAVIMLDAAIGAYLPFLLEERPELAEVYDGFTYYPNTISTVMFTNYGAPGLYGGHDRCFAEIVDVVQSTMRMLRYGIGSNVLTTEWKNDTGFLGVKLQSSGNFVYEQQHTEEMSMRRQNHWVKYLVRWYPTIVLLSVVLRSNIQNMPRSLFLAVHIFPATIASVIILWFYMPDVVKKVKAWKKPSLDNVLTLFFVVEVNIVTVVGILAKRTVPARAVDVPYYDILLITGIVLAYVTTKEEREAMLRVMSAVIVFSGILLIGETVWLVARGMAGQRPQGIYRNGYAASAMMVVGFWLPPFTRRPRGKVLQKGICLLAVLISLNRSMWLGMLCSAALYLLWHGREWYVFMKEKGGLQKRVVILAAVLAGLGVILAISGYGAIIVKRVGDLGNTSSHAIYGRLGFTAEAMRFFIFDESPIFRLFGHGRDTVENWMRSWVGHDDIIQGAYYGLHNEYMTILYEFGLVGLLGVVYLVIRVLQGAKYLDGADRCMAFGAVSMIAPCLVEDVGEYSTTPFIVFPLLVMAVTCYETYASNRKVRN